MAKPKLRSVVITGASSGIGRATAREFARRGASLVLAARRERALDEVVRECEELGGRAIAAPIDVSVADQVESLAQTAERVWGGFDTWVNNAAVTLFGRLEETPARDFERVLHTNLIGYANGARAAIRRFREQGAGHLIQVSSLVGHVGQPYTSAYVSSKWGIRGLTECLRMELLDAPGIHVSMVSPASIDTPIFQHGANYTGREAKAMAPVYPPEQVAHAIVTVAERPRREVFVGGSAYAMKALRSVSPGAAERLMARKVETDHLQHERPAPASSGNLFEPSRGERGETRGGWIMREHPPGNPRGVAAAAAVVAALVLPIGAYALMRARRR
jgi:short-subunit dehydrogenase